MAKSRTVEEPYQFDGTAECARRKIVIPTTSLLKQVACLPARIFTRWYLCYT
jgi:hypothetical protein